MPFVDGDSRSSSSSNDIHHPGRKRRWAGAEASRLRRLYSPERAFEGRARGGPVADVPGPRKVLPLAKRARLVDDDDTDYQPGHHAARTGRPGAGVPLTPCHVCHRRPTKKADLDSFADCQGCGRRTCYVCIRRCPGWRADDPPPSPMADDDDDGYGYDHRHGPRRHRPRPQPPNDDDDDDDDYDDEDDGVHADPPLARGHRAVVCSRCCVEQGREGDVVCLGCLAGMPDA